MIICSNSILLDCNPVLMNANASITCKPDLKTLIDGNGIQFSEELCNGFKPSVDSDIYAVNSNCSGKTNNSENSSEKFNESLVLINNCQNGIETSIHLGQSESPDHLFFQDEAEHSFTRPSTMTRNDRNSNESFSASCDKASVDGEVEICLEGSLNEEGKIDMPPTVHLPDYSVLQNLVKASSELAIPQENGSHSTIGESLSELDLQNSEKTLPECSIPPNSCTESVNRFNLSASLTSTNEIQEIDSNFKPACSADSVNINNFTSAEICEQPPHQNFSDNEKLENLTNSVGSSEVESFTCFEKSKSDVSAETNGSSKILSEPEILTKPEEDVLRNGSDCEKINSENSQEAGESEHVVNIQDYVNLKVNLSHYQSENERLQHKISMLESDLQFYKGQHGQLLLTIEQQEKQLKQINETAQRQQDLDARAFAAMKHELESQNELLKQEHQSMKREKEATVMRYAKSEMDVIQLRKELETCQKKQQEMIKERDSATVIMKQLQTDKSKFTQMYENKCSEARTAQNEIDELKTELNARDIKLKWAQNKLKTEADSHKETQSKLDKLSATIQASKNEAEQAKRDAQNSIKAFQESQENRAYVLEQELKEEQAKLIVARAAKETEEKKFQQLKMKFQQAEAEVKTLKDQNSALTDQLHNVEKRNLEIETKLSTMQQLMNKEVQENVELESQLAEMQVLRAELEKEKKKLEALESEGAKLRVSNAELLIDMDSCRKKEAEMLEFTERLTAQNVKLQSEFSILQAKNEELEMEQSRIDDLKAELEKEKTQRVEENKLLARHVAEHSQRCEELSKQLAEQKSENVVMRRKNAATVRELMRELQQAKKQFLEHCSDGGGSGSDSLCQDSRASSCASLTDNSQTLSASISGSFQSEPDKQTLIERIVDLQRKNAQYLEKIEFLEEHNQEMTEELKKKQKIVQNFMLREPTGALSSNSMDSNKVALSKKGYMASLYSSKIKDKNMTLEKSLEICQTLHSLLEDTILKNITLKENMDTLGEEIARLRSQQTQNSGS